VRPHPTPPKDEKEILAACDLALSLAPPERAPDLPPDDYAIAPFHQFEWDVWPIGESIRLAFVKNPKLKKSKAALAKLVEVACCVNLRRGRQSFIMAMGFVAARPLASQLITFLNDEDVNGHIIDTLLKMKVPGFGGQVQPLLGDKRAWVRRLAYRYLSRHAPLP